MAWLRPFAHGNPFRTRLGKHHSGNHLGHLAPATFLSSGQRHLSSIVHRVRHTGDSDLRRDGLALGENWQKSASHHADARSH